MVEATSVETYQQQEGRLFSPYKRDGNHWLHLNKKHTAHYSDHVQATVDLSIICPGHRSQVVARGRKRKNWILEAVPSNPHWFVYLTVIQKHSACTWYRYYPNVYLLMWDYHGWFKNPVVQKSAFEVGHEQIIILRRVIILLTPPTPILDPCAPFGPPNASWNVQVGRLFICILVALGMY